MTSPAVDTRESITLLSGCEQKGHLTPEPIARVTGRRHGQPSKWESTSVQFVPPNPNELFIARRTRRSRAVFAT